MSKYRLDCPRCNGTGALLADDCACWRGVKIGEAYVVNSSDCNAVERMLLAREKETILSIAGFIEEKLSKDAEVRKFGISKLSPSQIAILKELIVDIKYNFGKIE